MITFTVVVTGSTSLRLIWASQDAPGAGYTVYRGLTATFSQATALSVQLPSSAQWYNDYTCQPQTTYYYWLQDQASNLSGPQTATTAPAQINQDALDEPQMNALFQWAFGVWQGLYTAYWGYQPIPQPWDPKIRLNCISPGGEGGTDSIDPLGEALIGSRVATISVMVATNPTPAIRYLVGDSPVSDTPPAGVYTLTAVLNAGAAAPYSVTFAAPPVNGTAITQALIAIMQDNQTAVPPVATGLNAWTVGTDPQNLQLAIEPVEPSAALSVTSTSNMTAILATPPKAMTIAQRLWASLGDPTVCDLLDAAGIGVGDRHKVQDVSAMLETSAELMASFDFYVNLASVYPITPGIIDTVNTPSGTYVN